MLNPRTIEMLFERDVGPTVGGHFETNRQKCGRKTARKPRGRGVGRSSSGVNDHRECDFDSVVDLVMKVDAHSR